MASPKQIEANRLNALKSTGPRTEDGKASSRFNAVTHGLSASLPDALIGLDGYDDVEERKEAWRRELRPEGDAQDALFDTVVVESARVERCQRTFFALCRQHAERAREQWDDDRRRDAEELAAGIARSPRLIAARLEATPHGCDVKIDLWTGLAAILNRHKVWTDPQRSMALDLLGIHPELRDAGTPLDDLNGDESAGRLALIATEIVRLKTVRERVVSSDQTERAMAEQTLGVEFTKPVQRLDRYERAAVRRQDVAWKRLIQAKKAATPEAAPTKPAPPREVAPPVAPPESVAKRAVTFDPFDGADPIASIATPARSATPVHTNRRQRRRLAALERRAS
jgi:hypothetical protein